HGWLPFAADSITAVWHSDAARGPSTPSFDHLVGGSFDHVIANGPIPINEPSDERIGINAPAARSAPLEAYSGRRRAVCPILSPLFPDCGIARPSRHRARSSSSNIRAWVIAGSALVEHENSASPPNPDICALMSTARGRLRSRSAVSWRLPAMLVLAGDVFRGREG